MTKSTITRERLEKIASWRETYGDEHNVMLPAGEADELARIALAAMDSEPVAYMWDSKRNDIDAPGFYFPEHLFFAESNVKQWGGEVIPLYRHAQPAPVVAEEKPIPNTLSMYVVDAVAAIAEVKGWNACRAAMLQNVTLANEGDIQAGNSLEIPEGYVLVPVEPTDEMIAAAMECDDVLFNSDETFCVQFGNIYDAMIAAAPQEVTSARFHPARDE